jgi:hypothetical protein
MIVAPVHLLEFCSDRCLKVVLGRDTRGVPSHCGVADFPDPLRPAAPVAVDSRVHGVQAIGAHAARVVLCCRRRTKGLLLVVAPAPQSLRLDTPLSRFALRASHLHDLGYHADKHAILAYLLHNHVHDHPYCQDADDAKKDQLLGGCVTESHGGRAEVA